MMYVVCINLELSSKKEDDMIKDYIIKFYRENTGALIGALIGLVMAILILIIGFLKTVFIAIFVAICSYIGNKISKDKDCIKKFLDRILPPGTYR